MLHTIRQYKRVVAGLGLATLLTVSMAAPAFAADTATATVTAGTLTASYADLTIAAVSYSHSAQTTDSQDMTLTADDSTGSGDGWNVTVLSSAFVYSGDNGGTNIPAANFVFGTPNTPIATAGQAVDGIGGPTAGVGGALDAAKKVISANADFGQGTYTQTVGAQLTIPAQSRAGTYTGTLTTTISAGP